MLRVGEAARRLRCSPSTIYALCRLRTISHIRVGAGRGSIRIRENDLDEYIARNRVREDDKGPPQETT